MPAGMVRPRPSQNAQALRDRIGAPVDVWLAASTLLCRPCPTGEPYPHICGQWVREERVGRRGCAACGEAAAVRQDRATGALAPPETPEVDRPREEST